MISQELYDRLLRITKLNRFTSYDAREMEQLIRDTFNPQYTVCTHCPQQIKFGQRLIVNFLNTTQVEGQELPEEVLFPSEPELDVDVVEAEKVGCQKCKKKRQTKK